MLAAARAALANGAASVDLPAQIDR
jgi:hypothetical protein